MSDVDEKPLLIPFPNPRMAMPELLVPGRKPVGEVEIDWNHPLGKYVKYAFVPVAGKANDVIHGGLSSIGDAVVKENAEFPTTSGNAFLYEEKISTITECTIITRLSISNSSRVGGIFSDQDLSNFNAGVGISLLTGGTGSSSFKWQIGYATLTVTDSSIPLDTFFTVVVVWKASQIQKVYINGVEEGSYGSPATSYLASTIAPKIGTYYNGDTVYSYNGDIEYLYFLNKAIPPEQIALFHNNPYQFLKPKTPAFFPVPRRELEEDRLWLDPKMSMPELYQPNRKPVGDVEIDWSHPLAPNELCVVFNDEKPVDLTKKYNLTLNGSVDIRPLSATKVLNVTTENALNECSLDKSIVLSADVPWSLSLALRTTGSNLKGMLFGDASASGTYMWVRDGSYLRIKSESQESDFTLNNDYSSSLKNITIISDGKGANSCTYTLFVNGQFSESLSSRAGTFTVNALINGYNSSSLFFLGILSYAYIMTGDSALSSHLLGSDPNQFLKPKSAPILIDSGNSIKDGFFLPDDKMLQPEMLVPKRKPTGNVEIDWTHPLAHKIETFYLCDEEGQVIDLCGNYPLTETTGNKPDLKVGAEGKYLNFTRSNDEHLQATKTTEGLSFPYTMMVRGNIQDSDSTAKTMFSMGSLTVTQNRHVQLYGSLAKFRYGVSTNQSATCSQLGSFTLGQNYTITGVSRDKENHELYIDGVPDNIVVDVFSDLYWDQCNSYAIGKIPRPNVDYDHEGDVHWAASWRRGLSAAEIKSMNDNPYQFLKPKSAPKYIPPSDHGFNLPDSRMEMPELYMPGRKPTGKVKIDVNHPLAPNELSVLFQDSAFTDLTGNYRLTPSTGIPVLPYGNNQCAYTSLTAPRQKILLNDTIELLTETSWTIVARCKADSTVAESDRHFIGTDGASSSRIVVASDDHIKLNNQQGWWYDFTDASNFGSEIRTFAITANGTSTASLYYDGELEATRSIGGYPSLNIDCLLEAYSGTDNFSFFGRTEFIYVYKGVTLSAAEIKALTQDPYQFLIPE